MRSVIIVQARMGSTRLPGKVLRRVAGQPLLQTEIDRLRKVRKADAICVATTTKSADDAICVLCREMEIPVFRGAEDDVLSRYSEAARFMEADEVIRVTADCPFVDPDVVDAVIEKRRSENADYSSNTLVRTFPRGLDAECMTRDVLVRASREAAQPWEREHVTPFIYTHPECFSLRNVSNDLDLNGFRWTVDTPEDLQFVTLILEHFSGMLSEFTMSDVVTLLEANPEWNTINAHIEQKKVFSQVNDNETGF